MAIFLKENVGTLLINRIDTATINIRRCNMKKGFRPEEEAVFFQEEKYYLSV